MTESVLKTKPLDPSIDRLIRLAIREAREAGMDEREIIDLIQRLIREQKENSNHDSSSH